MAIYSFFSIQSPTEGTYKEKGSKFIALAYPVQSEEEIKEKIEAIKKEYYDARHHCFAYVLGADKARYRAFDDGEPNHSAGDPILGQIRSRSLTNVLVVVVRYFGGTKLGVSGLITAYKTAAEEALKNAAVIEHEVMKRIDLSYDYSSVPEVMRLVKEFDVQIREQQYADTTCILRGEVRLKHYPSIMEKLQLLIALRHPIRLLE